MDDHSQGTALTDQERADEDAEFEEIHGIVVGTLVRGAPPGTLLVDHEVNPAGAPLEARSLVRTTPADTGRAVALGFEEGDPRRPIVLGFMHETEMIELTPGEPAVAEPAASADGERLVFSASREIVLECGKASITLTRAGKILIRGAYLLSRSTGVNRIKGGSVQIN